MSPLGPPSTLDDPVAARRLAERLRAGREKVLGRWRERARELPSARDLPDPLLQDEVGELLDELVRHLEAAAGAAEAHEGERPAGEGPGKDGAAETARGSGAHRAEPERDPERGEAPSATRSLRREARAAALHGAERLRLGFDIEEVVYEYNLLRELVFEAGARDAPLPRSLIAFVNDIVDVSVGTAVKTYARQHALEERRRRAEHIAFVTHEMRTPLATIGTLAQVLRARQDPPDARVVGGLQRAAEALDGLVRQLIEESRRIGGDIERDSRPVRVRLAPLVEAITADLGELAAHAGISLRNEVPDDLEVRADPNILDIVLANLVKNAIDHSGGTRVVVGAEVAGGRATCRVEDDGRGIPPEHLATVFEPYRTRSDTGGTGLGLYIAQRFAAALGGRLTAHSSGRGARFQLTLPLPHED